MFVLLKNENSTNRYGQLRINLLVYQSILVSLLIYQLNNLYRILREHKREHLAKIGQFGCRLCDSSRMCLV